jgi:hypothetical protein
MGYGLDVRVSILGRAKRFSVLSNVRTTLVLWVPEAFLLQ